MPISESRITDHVGRINYSNPSETNKIVTIGISTFGWWGGKLSKINPIHKNIS